MPICVDASLVVKWLTPEEGSDIALRLFKRWQENGDQLIAPALLDYEVGSSLRQKVYRSLLSADDLFPIIDFYKRTNLLLLHLSDLVAQAIPLAASLGQPTIYDVTYLLLAKQQKAPFVTADERFYLVAHKIHTAVHYYKKWA